MPYQNKPAAAPKRPADLVLKLDRIELRVAVLVNGRGHAITVPLDRLPREPRPAPGDLIRVPLGEEERPLWHAATIDRAADRMEQRDGGTAG
ncbi:MAG TPA: hypothetical protein VFH97_02575 [Gemmatimonadales bacterium]|nr:hypothetical protein [Gemmatimonadales bacterium]